MCDIWIDEANDVVKAIEEMDDFQGGVDFDVQSWVSLHTEDKPWLED